MNHLTQRTNNKIRLCVQQPALPKYRVPFFKELASRAGIDLSVYYSTDDPSLPNSAPDGFNAMHVPMRKFSKRWRIIWHSPQWTLASRDYSDVLVLSWDIHYLSLVPSLLKARITGVPVLLWGHGYSKQENRLRRTLRQAVACLATGLVFYDFKTSSDYVRTGWPAERIHVAPNAVDQAAISAARLSWKEKPGRLAKFRQDHGIGDGPNLIFIGRIYPENRLDILIQALPLISGEYPETRLIVIGAGGAEVDRLKALGSELAVQDRIVWTGALYDEEEIAPWMLSADLCCYPANIGLSLLHAFGYGVPVITGEQVIRHNPEIYALNNGVNGMLFRQDSSEALAESVCRLLCDSEKLNSMRAEALKTVTEVYNIPRMADGFEAAVRFAAGLWLR